MKAFILLLLSSALLFAQLNISNPFFVGGVLKGSSATVLTFITGQTLGSARQDVTGSVGFKVTPSANLTATQLGRWVIAGNTKTHSLRIFGSACNILASVTVDCSGAATGTYLYGTLASPFTLTNGLVYYIMSEENSAGGFDEWYGDTIVTTTSDATANNVSYEDGACNLSTALKVWGPVNFKYTNP